MEEGGDDTPLIHYPERGAPRYSAQRPAALLRSRKFRRTRVSTYTTPYFTCRHCNAIITVDIVRGRPRGAAPPSVRSAAAG